MDVKNKDTSPEILVRKAAHRLGLRFRLHDHRLPGKPDLIFPRWKRVIFVNGCFWHRHEGCRKATIPKSNTEFCVRKFSANAERDKNNYQKVSEK